MSYTKSLRRRLPKMTTFDLQAFRAHLLDVLDRERNPMIRASAKERVQMIDGELTKRGIQS